LLMQDSEHAEALNFYGYSLADRDERLADALVMVEKALVLKPDDGYYLDSLAWVYYKQGNSDKAVKVQLQAVAVVPNDAVMQEHLGDIYWKAKQPENARKYWQKALDLHHSDPDMIQQKLAHGLSPNL